MNNENDKRFLLLDAALGLLVAIVLGEVGSLIGMVLFNEKFGSTPEPLGALIGGFIGLWGGFYSCVYLVSHLRLRCKVSEYFRFGIPSKAEASVSIIVGIALQFLLGYLIYSPFANSRYVAENLSKPAQNLLGQVGSYRFAIVAVLVVFVAPYFEEIFFRGLVYRGFKSSLPLRLRYRVPLSQIFSSLIFAFAHGEWLQFPGLFLLGVVLAYVFEKSGKLMPCYTIHATFNLCAVIIAFIS